MINSILHIAFAILSLAAALAFIRLVKGPSLEDRVVAFDLITYIFGGLILLLTLYNNSRFYIDIVIVMSAIVFLGTVAIANFLNKNEP